MASMHLVRDFKRFVDQYIKAHGCFGENMLGQPCPFIPRLPLDSYWTTERINTVLGNLSQSAIENVLEVRERYLVVLSISVYALQPEKITLFIHENIEDAQLPLPTLPYAFSELRNEMKFFEAFCEQQWKFCPLSMFSVAEIRPQRRHLAVHHIIPVTGRKTINPQATEGEDGISIYRAELHPECSDEKVIVFKVFRGRQPEVEQLYEAEVEMYSHVAEMNTFDHVVQYYGSIESEGIRIIMLEHAAGGSLRTYFQRVQPPRSLRDTELFWHSLMGLFNGIESITESAHYEDEYKIAKEKSRAHYTVQPQNIVVCTASDTSQYAVAFKFVGTRDSRKTSEKPDAGITNEGVYSAPLADKNVGAEHIVRGASRVWSLGCVASEALVWAIGGEGKRRLYHRERIHAARRYQVQAPASSKVFYDLMLPTVQHWHARSIAAAGNARDWYSRLSQLILNSMLVPDASSRKGAPELGAEWNALSDSLSRDFPRTMITGGFIEAKNPSFDNGFSDSGYSSVPRVDNWVDDRGDHDSRFDDFDTILSDSERLHLTEPEKYCYIDHFVAMLYDGVVSRIGKITRQLDTEEAMRPLLKTFSMNLSRTDKSSEAGEVSTFIRQHRNYIAMSFQEAVQRDVIRDFEEKPEKSLIGHGEAMGFDEKFSAWNVADPGNYDFSKDETHEGDLDADVPAERFSKYQETLSKAQAFDWLLGAIEKHVRLNLDEALAIHHIQAAISPAFGCSFEVGSEAAIFSVLIEMEWDAYSFIKQQEYPDYRSLETALTISGSATMAQLLPCQEYLRQCWPSLGESVLKAITSLPFLGHAKTTATLLTDGTKLSVALKNGRTTFWCQGTSDTITTVAEIVTWMGSSLREASSTNGIAYMTPILSKQGDIHHSKEGRSNSPTRFVIKFQEDIVRDWKEGNQNGCCWQGLLGNPVIAKDFPVLRRDAEIAGLEVPLSIMASLVGAERLTEYREQVLFKGYNAAIVPVAVTQDMFSWHMVVNDSSERLAYTDRRISTGGMSTHCFMSANIRTSRHILGWTPSALHNIGSSSATYDGLWASPNFISSGLVLQKVIVQGGFDPLTVGVEAAIGKKDPSPNIIRGDAGYLRSIESLIGTYVVLYDTRDHRAWLANGASCLLHLTRASLRHGLMGALSKEYILDESQLGDTSRLTSPQAAVDFLCDRTKLHLPIFKDAVEAPGSTHQVHIRLVDCVNQIRYILEQLLDYQATLSSPGMPLTLSPRSRLEGYKFMDIATRRPITPCAVSLNMFRQGGKSWVDFTRAIKAVTLFGKGFGDLITPLSDPSVVCSKWQSLPKLKDYLAVSTYDLARIIEERGDCESHKVAPDICWHQPASLFEECACKSKSQGLRDLVGLRRSCDRVQVLLPELRDHTLWKAPRMLPNNLEGTGAVIFGRSTIFPWRWPEEGHPEQDFDVDQDDDAEAGHIGRGSTLSVPTPTSSRPTSTTPAPDSSQTGTATTPEDAGLGHRGLTTISSSEEPSPRPDGHKRSIRERFRGFLHHVSLKNSSGTRRKL